MIPIYYVAIVLPLNYTIIFMIILILIAMDLIFCRNEKTLSGVEKSMVFKYVGKKMMQPFKMHSSPCVQRRKAMNC